MKLKWTIIIMIIIIIIIIIIIMLYSHTYAYTDKHDTYLKRWSAVEPRHCKGPREWQNLFAITRFL